MPDNNDPFGFDRDFRRILGFVLILIVCGCAIAWFISNSNSDPVSDLITSLP